MRQDIEKALRASARDGSNISLYKHFVDKNGLKVLGAGAGASSASPTPSP